GTALQILGLEQTPAAPEISGSLRRVYRHPSGPIALSVAAGSSGSRSVPVAGAVMPRASLLTRVDPSGRLAQLYTFEVRDWPQPTLPIRLPRDAKLIALRIDGRDALGLLASA